MISSCTYYLILYFYPYSALYHLLYCGVLITKAVYYGYCHFVSMLQVYW